MSFFPSKNIDDWQFQQHTQRGGDGPHQSDSTVLPSVVTFERPTLLGPTTIYKDRKVLSCINNPFIIAPFFFFSPPFPLNDSSIYFYCCYRHSWSRNNFYYLLIKFSKISPTNYIYIYKNVYFKAYIFYFSCWKFITKFNA